MTPAKPITGDMIDAVLCDYATNEEADRVFDAALTDADVRKRLGLLSFAEEEEKNRRRDANAVRILATVLLGMVFLVAGLLWLYANVTGPLLRIVGTMFIAVSAGWSSLTIVRLVTPE